MRSREYKRLEALLLRDKAEMDPAVRAAAIADFKRVAEEYFETDGKVRLDLREGKGGEEGVVTFRVLRVKNFTPLR